MEQTLRPVHTEDANNVAIQRSRKHAARGERRRQPHTETETQYRQPSFLTTAKVEYLEICEQTQFETYNDPQLLADIWDWTSQKIRQSYKNGIAAGQAKQKADTE